jgi:hypothetical protein
VKEKTEEIGATGDRWPIGHLVKDNKPRTTRDAVDVNGRPGGTANILETAAVHSAEDGAVLATALTSVQEPAEPVLSTDEVRTTDNGEPVVETGDAPTPRITEQTPEEEVARTTTDTEQETTPVSKPSTPVSTAATTIVAGEVRVEPTVREQATEIMMMLETVMQRVCC